MSPLFVTLLVLGLAILLFLTETLRPDLVALLVVVALGASGVLSAPESFSGFSRSAVVTLFAIYILAAGLERTGVTRWVGSLLLRVAGRSERRLVVVVMLAGSFLSLFMNNIAAASVLLPAASGAARRARVNPSRLLMPLAFSTLLGGMATLFTTTNILVSSSLRERGLRGFGLFDLAPVGLPLVAAGILYMALWGRGRLPAESPAQKLAALERREQGLAEVYRLEEGLRQAGVPERSRLAGATLAASGLRETRGLTVLAVQRGGRILPAPGPDFRLAAEDVLFLSGEMRGPDLAGELEILPAPALAGGELESPAVGIFEAVLSPRSALIGQTARDCRFRDRYDLAVLAVWRAGRPLRTGLSDLRFELGDGLLLQGERESLTRLRSDPDLILLDRGDDEPPLPPGKARLAAGILLATLALAAVSGPAMGEVMLGGALVMVLAGVLTMDHAYRAVEWPSLFLVAGMLPLGLAMTKTGAAALLTHGLLAGLQGLGVGRAGPLVLLAGVVLFAGLLTQAMSGAAVAAVVAPVAIEAAQQVGANPRALALGVALATSMAFLTPLGHPVNVLVMGPGGYTFKDYLRVGLPLLILTVLLTLVLVPVFWRLS